MTNLFWVLQKKCSDFFSGLRDLLGTPGFPLAILVQEFP